MNLKNIFLFLFLGSSITQLTSSRNTPSRVQTAFNEARENYEIAKMKVKYYCSRQQKSFSSPFQVKNSLGKKVEQKPKLSVENLKKIQSPLNDIEESSANRWRIIQWLMDSGKFNEET